MYKLLIDGDIIAFQAAAATDGRTYTLSNGEQFKYKKDADKRAKELDCTVTLEFFPEPIEHAIYLMRNKLLGIFENLESLGIEVTESIIYLSSGGSFREKLVPTYKSNREGTRTPANLSESKQYLLNHHDAIVKPGEYEADDLITIEAHKLVGIGCVPIICSIDKDLKQYPTKYYHFNNKTVEDISEDQALRYFYSQLLTGDNCDGIVGIKGIGPKTAEKILKPHHDAVSMYTAVLDTWIKKTPRLHEETEEDFCRRVVHLVRTTGQLLYLCRYEGELWQAPEEVSEED